MELFCLNWSEHGASVRRHFWQLLQLEQLCDVTLACEGASLKAHKLVLSAASPFFHQLFLDNPAANPIVILSDLKHADLKTLIQFMYQGHANVSENQLPAILKAAQNLKIKGLGNAQEDPKCSVKEKAALIHTDHSYVNEEPSPTLDPSKLMEQSMTTQEECAKKLFLCNSPESFSSDCVHLQLPPPELEEEDSNSSPHSMEVLDSSKRGRKPGSRLCVLCKHVFHSEGELEQHMEEHKTTSSEELPALSGEEPLHLPLRCSSCGYAMSTVSDAQSHLSAHPGCRTSQFACPLCPKLFIWPATLTKHFREQHEGGRRRWYFCDVCKKPLLSKHALALHRSKFHGIPTAAAAQGAQENLDNCKRGRKRGTRVCGICKRTFLGSEYFAHVQSVHKNISLSDSSVEASIYMSESMDNESNSTQSAT